VDHAAWDYFATGVDDETTLAENHAAFERIRLRPRALVDASAPDLRTTVLGSPISMPILVAPSAAHGFAHPDAERATARGAGAARTLMVASTESTAPLEEIAAAATGPLWFQLYVYRNRQIAETLLRRAEDAGFRAVVLTVDLPVNSKKERAIRSEDRRRWLPEGNLTGLAVADLEAYNLTWRDLAWLRSRTSLPLVLKGILTAEDAALAVEHGAEGIVVSNHGGRALDSVPASIEALPEVAQAVAGRCEVYLDGGVRRGTDVLKALALGARAVLIGRPALWGLAVDGAQGVQHVLELLRAELERAMRLAGAASLARISRALLASSKESRPS
jgi:isopentenyl diphosphate isomerase/L-lactate dehydrogenase-like FMN-dependent dehydrogenase